MALHGLWIDEVRIVGLESRNIDAITDLGDIEVMIDDHHRHIDDAIDSGRVKRPVLFTRPWNLHARAPHRITELSELTRFLGT